MLGRPNNFGAWPSQAIFELGKSSQNIGNSNTKLDLKVSRAGYSNDGEDMPTLMTWTADYFGRVGIKIDNPDAVLDVNGVTRVRDNIITGTSNNYIAGGGYAAIIGGFRDTILAGSGSSMIGTVNSDIESGVAYSVIVGGSGNRIATGGHNGAIIAGISNILSHTNSVVMGSNASSTSAYQFTAKFSGGYRLFSNVAGTAGVTLASGGGAWVAVSDKNKKENFFQIDKKEILNKVANLNVENWNYKSQSDSIRHIGPYAQDFFQAFGLGSDSLGIETTDISGVNMAAIQGLYEYIQELELNVSNLKTENSTLKSELNNSKLRDEELKSEIEVIKLMLQRVEK